LAELMLVTAVALFFSTFSTPLLSAALTFGLYVVGHFNADLRNFDRIVESPPAVWLARAVYHVAPDLSAFDVKLQVVHGLPVPAEVVVGQAQVSTSTT
jgi:Cu-processing system permease protein